MGVKYKILIVFFAIILYNSSMNLAEIAYTTKVLLQDNPSFKHDRDLVLGQLFLCILQEEIATGNDIDDAKNVIGFSYMMINSMLRSMGLTTSQVKEIYQYARKKFVCGRHLTYKTEIIPIAHKCTI